MAGGLNKVLIIGNVGRDPEMRYTPGGAAVTSFSVAVSRRWNTPENELREETEWFNIVAWNKLAETCNQLITKGRKVFIEGRLQTRSWDDRESGQKKYRTEVVAQTMLLLDGRPQAGQAGPGGQGPREDAGFPTDEVEPDDIPF